ncbi:hypothetical protein DFH08DRAFT_964835 [Mycena albidolilacea]|uniref:Uncharacterized protein n=1 Tax=Mycena albidolilacea TaxID=1033008 RepID=A0AAD6ZSI4_9AGAR|nr:hypothetical protein DFH08DRAFT_964835 [Mycena albidolilacea]
MENVDFWQRVGHYEPGGTGRISAFTVFTKEGHWMENELKTTAMSKSAPETLSAAQFWKTVGMRVSSSGDPTLWVGGVDDTMQPVSGRWLFVKDEKAMEKEVENTYGQIDGMELRRW